MNNQIENFPDCVRCEVADLVARLDVGRLMALRDFLSAWGYEPAPRPKPQPASTWNPEEYVKTLAAAAQAKPVDPETFYGYIRSASQQAQFQPPNEAFFGPLGCTSVSPRTEPEPQAATTKKRGRKSRVSDDELRQLVGSGLSDTEIARQFGVTKSGIRNRRARLGLAANFRRGQKATKPKPRRPVVAEPKAVPVKLKMPEPGEDGVRHCPPGPEEAHFDNHQFE